MPRKKKDPCAASSSRSINSSTSSTYQEIFEPCTSSGRSHFRRASSEDGSIERLDRDRSRIRVVRTDSDPGNEHATTEQPPQVRTRRTRSIDSVSGNDARLIRNRDRERRRRESESKGERAERLLKLREGMRNRLRNETEEDRAERLRNSSERARKRYNLESSEQRSERLRDLRERKRARRVSFTLRREEEESEEGITEIIAGAESMRLLTSPEDSAISSGRGSTRYRNIRVKRWADYFKSAFNYAPSETLEINDLINIGARNISCSFCSALKWRSEAPSLCCSNGKISLEPLQSPPEPLRGFYEGESRESKSFLKNIRKYNAAFQMTSFGGKEIHEGFMPTFKVTNIIIIMTSFFL